MTTGVEAGSDTKHWVLTPRLTAAQVTAIKALTDAQFLAVSHSGGVLTINSATYTGHDLVDNVVDYDPDLNYEDDDHSSVKQKGVDMELGRQNFSCDATLLVDASDDMSSKVLTQNPAAAGAPNARLLYIEKESGDYLIAGVVLQSKRNRVDGRTSRYNVRMRGSMRPALESV